MLIAQPALQDVSLGVPKLIITQGKRKSGKYYDYTLGELTAAELEC